MNLMIWLDTLLFRSCMQCSLGGKIEFVTSGQIPLPQDALDDIEKMREERAKEEEEGFGWLDAVEMVPVIGSIVGMVREAKKGNWGMAILNLGFLVADVAGVVSFGASTAASTAAKAAVKTGVKVAAKSAAKTAAKQVGKSGLKTGTKLFAKGAAKAFKSNIDKIIGKASKGKLCVFACFPAGTLIHTEFGIKNIEDIKVGDKVWSCNEETGETGLKEVLQTMERDADVTLKLKVGDEVIETTAEHPFYTQEGWKDAADLRATDVLLTKDGVKKEVDSIEYSYKSKKVFNFAVADWQTYFVGLWAWLAHNARTCLSSLQNFPWGKFLKSHIGPPPSWMKRAHAHHIVFKKGTKAMQKYLKESKRILKKYGIDPLKGLENLVWAPNKNHTVKAAKTVTEALKEADKVGTKEAVSKALKEMGEHFAKETITKL